jgi:hypothetical protein
MRKGSHTKSAKVTTDKKIWFERGWLGEGKLEGVSVKRRSIRMASDTHALQCKDRLCPHARNASHSDAGRSVTFVRNPLGGPPTSVA